MNKRVILAGVLGGLAMFIWNSTAHVALPIAKVGVQEIANEVPLLQSMQNTVKGSGLYLFPSMPASGDQAEYAAKLASGPTGVLVYSPNRQVSVAPLLGTEFASELLQAMIAALLVSMTRLSSFGGRLGFYASLGLIAAVTTNVSYWNWYAFPGNYTLAYMTMTFVGYICAGLAAATILGRGGRKASTAAA